MDTPTQFGKNRGWFIAYGILFLILGIIAIYASTLVAVVSIVLLGSLLIISGIINLVDDFTFWRHKPTGFTLHLIMAILYIIAGILLIKNPIVGAASITLIMAIFYILLGFFRIMSAVYLKMPFWGWQLTSGIIAVLLGFIILAYWPTASLLIIGLFIGIELLFLGWTYIMLGVAAKRMPSA